MIAGLCGTSSKASNYLCHHCGQKRIQLDVDYELYINALFTISCDLVR